MTAAVGGPGTGAPPGMERAAAPLRNARAFGEAVRDARRAADARTSPAKRAGTAARLVPVRAPLRRASKAAEERLDGSRNAAADARAAAARDAPPVALAAPIASASVVARVAIAARGLGPAASLELRFPGELGIALSHTPQGVAVVIDPGALPRVRALAELPSLVRALRDRGVPVASARVAGLRRRVDAREGLR